MQKTKRNALVWLRNDLRMEDHFSFHDASQNCDSVIAYYSFDPKQFEYTKWGFRKTGNFRTQFLIESLNDLKQTLAEKNISLIEWNIKIQIFKYQILNNHILMQRNN